MKITRLPPQFITTYTKYANGLVADMRGHEIRTLQVQTPTCSSTRLATLTEQSASWLIECEDDEVPGIDWTELDRMA